MNLTDNAQQLLTEFSKVNGWEQKMRLLMQYGQQLSALDADARIPQNQVSGCESQVWLTKQQIDGFWYFKADSDARIIKGLLAVLLARVNGLSSEQLQQVDLQHWFEQLGLAKQLSSSRRDGLLAIMKQIKSN